MLERLKSLGILETDKVPVKSSQEGGSVTGIAAWRANNAERIREESLRVANQQLADTIKKAKEVVNKQGY